LKQSIDPSTTPDIVPYERKDLGVS
jgi:hypothetical protein